MISREMWKPGLDFTFGSKCRLNIRQFQARALQFQFHISTDEKYGRKGSSYLYLIDACKVLCFLLMCILSEFDVGVWKPQWLQVKPSETSCLASMCLLMSESLPVLYSQLYSQWYSPSSQRWCCPEKAQLIQRWSWLKYLLFPFISFNFVYDIATHEPYVRPLMGRFDHKSHTWTRDFRDASL